MRSPLSSPAAWCGRELFERDDWFYAFDDADAAEVDQALRDSRGLPMQSLTPQSFPLPTLSKLLERRRNSLEHASGVSLLRGIPIGRYSDDDAARILFGVTAHLGTAVPQTIDGEVVFPVRDERLGDSHPKARGPSSAKRLSYHTDRCDVIAFLCVRQATEGGENFLVSSISLFNEMLSQRPDLVDVLMEPFRYQRHNIDLGNVLPYYEQPIFSFCEGHFAASFLRVLIDRAYAADPSVAMSDRQREAMDYLEKLADDPSLHVSFRQQPGDIVLMNNWVTMHRRSEFVDDEDQAKRRLLWRIWLSMPNSRPIDQRFAASYGATAAGAVRGGMRAT